MKNIALLGLLLLFPLLMEAQSPQVRKFYRQQPKRPGTVKVFLPGWLVKMGVGIMGKQLGENKDIAKAAAKPMRNLRVLTIEDPAKVQVQKFQRLLKSVEKRDYNNLIMVRDQGETSVNIMMKQKVKRNGKKLIKGLLILVVEEDEMVLVSLKGRWNLQKIVPKIKSLNLFKDKLPQGPVRPSPPPLPRA